MLAHVFNDILFNSPEVCTPFLCRAIGVSELNRAWRDGDTIRLEGVAPLAVPIKKTRSKKKKPVASPIEAQWTSGRIYQKLEEVPSKYSVPVLWKLCRYYDTDDETCEALRAYVKTTIGLKMERTPFYLWKTYRLYSRFKKLDKKFTETHKYIKLNVDKDTISIVILPHKGVVKTLLERLSRELI